MGLGPNSDRSELIAYGFTSTTRFSGTESRTQSNIGAFNWNRGRSWLVPRAALWDALLDLEGEARDRKNHTNCDHCCAGKFGRSNDRRKSKRR